MLTGYMLGDNGEFKHSFNIYRVTRNILGTHGVFKVSLSGKKLHIVLGVVSMF